MTRAPVSQHTIAGEVAITEGVSPSLIRVCLRRFALSGLGVKAIA